jgi:Flp pilus assembly protein protease CpaA
MQYIPFITALFGSAIAGAYDLKTTEIPDVLPYSMIAIGLAYYLYLSLTYSNFYYLIISLAVGLLFLGFGFVMYFLGQWGGGDAKLLSAMGFLLPIKPEFSVQTLFPFPLSFFINLFLIGAAYMLLYAFIYSLMNRKILQVFVKEVKASSKFLFLSFASFLIFIFFSSYYIFTTFFEFVPLSFIVKFSLLISFLTLIFFLIWKFARIVEKVGFVKRISVKKLKVGDILAESKYIEGITEKELRKIKRSGKKFVKIKTGVRFAPAFTLALLFTVFFGDALIFLRFVV